MCLLFCLRQTRWGAGPGPVAIDREVVYSDMTDWRRFGRAPDFSDGRLRTRSLNDGIAEDVEGFMYGSVRLRPCDWIIPLN